MKKSDFWMGLWIAFNAFIAVVAAHVLLTMLGVL